MIHQDIFTDDAIDFTITKYYDDLGVRQFGPTAHEICSLEQNLADFFFVHWRLIEPDYPFPQ